MTKDVDLGPSPFMEASPIDMTPIGKTGEAAAFIGRPPMRSAMAVAAMVIRRMVVSDQDVLI